MNVKSLIWDSAFFNLRVGQVIIENEQNINFDIEDDFDLIYLKTSLERNVDINAYSCSFSETRVVFEKEVLGNNNFLSTHIVSIHDVNYKINDLYELALESGKFSRFHLDPKFSKENFKKLYMTWIDNSLNKSFAGGFLVYKILDKIVGFVTYKTCEDVATIGLIGINFKHQGKGLGTQLINAVENQLINTGFYILRIPTQLKNKEACNFYKKLRYLPVEKTQIKHYWRDSFQ